MPDDGHHPGLPEVSASSLSVCQCTYLHIQRTCWPCLVGLSVLLYVHLRT